MPILTLVVAHARNRVIGRDNTLPWRLPPDLQHFKRVTLGKPIVMGRKTWESLGRPLPGRHNIVISRNAGYEAAGATVVDSLSAALAAAGDVEEVCVIGGAQIYEQALALADRIIATEIDADVAGDAWFPALPDSDWKQAVRDEQPPHDDLPYAFVTWTRRRA